MNIDDEVNKRVARSRVEADEGWRNWCKEAPWLQFPPELEVKIVPPFGGAMARFYVRFAGSSDESKHVSVYWDCKDNLGFMNAPYWEIYPVRYKGEYGGAGDDEDYWDTARFSMGEEPQMMVSIIKALMGEYE